MTANRGDACRKLCLLASDPIKNSRESFSTPHSDNPGTDHHKRQTIKKGRLSDPFSTKFGRHDWTRTNDPHHVKVVL